MYVIQVSGTTADTNIGKTTSNVVLIPADQCTFTSTYSSSDNAYQLTNVRIYDGAAARRVLSTSNSYELGYIGKSGRFVAITD